MSSGGRALLILGFIQIAAVVLLYGRISVLENELRDSNLKYQATNRIDSSLNSPFTQSLVDEHPSLSADQIRRIVREELETFSNSQEESLIAQAETEQGVSPQGQDVELQHKLLSDKLDNYISLGYIGRTEMTELQSEITRLDGARRTEMFRQLVRAINSGQLEGEL